MKIKAKVLIAAFIFAFILGVLSESAQYLAMLHMTIYSQAAINVVVSIVSAIVNPLLLFITFYFMGKKTETINDFYSYLFSFFLGNWIGLTLGHSITLAVVLTAFSSVSAVGIGFTILAWLWSSLLSYSFFVGCSALAIGCIVSKKAVNANITTS